MVARKPSLLAPRFCRECGGSLKRSGPFGYRCTSCGTVRELVQHRDFVLPRPGPVVEAGDATLAAPVVIQRSGRWARARRGIARLGDATIGVGRILPSVGL